MENKSLEKFDKIVERGRITPTTKASCIRDINQFVDVMNLGEPDKALATIRELDDREKYIDNVIDQMLTTLSATSVVRILRSVKIWLRINGVDVDWDAITLPSTEVIEEDRMPTKDELRRLLNVVNLRDKTFVLVASSSGLRRRTLVTLKFGDVNFDYPDVARIMVTRRYTIKGKQFSSGRKISKKRKFFVTFITPEAKKMLLEYKRYREEIGEKITDESPLFTSTRKDELGKFLSARYIDTHWGRILKRAHLADKGVNWFQIHFHTLKKYAETQMINANVKQSYREFFLGHKGAYLEVNYFKGEEEKCLEEYRRAIPYLSIIEVPPSLEDLKRRQELTERLFDKSMRGEPWTDEERELVKRYGIALRERAHAEANGVDCGERFKEIHENDLLGYLREGWQVAHKLENGKVIIRKG